MTILSGVRSGLRSGLRSGVNPIMGVTRDLQSGKYTPDSGDEFRNYLAAIGSTLVVPHHLWRMQVASGNVPDEIGGGLGTRNLTATTAGNAPAYRKSITGWSRFAIGGPGAAVASSLANTSMGNTASASFLLFWYGRSDAATVLRNLMVYGSPQVQQPASSKTRLRMGASITDSTNNHAGDVVPYLFAFNITATTIKLYSHLEIVSVTYASSAGSTLTATLSGTGDTTAADLLLMAGWDNVETTDAEARKFITGLGYAPSW